MTSKSQYHNALKFSRKHFGTDLMARPTTKSDLLDMPTEMLLQIFEYLSYPEALVMKTTHSRFRMIIEPSLTVARRVQWLVQRAEMGLRVPKWSPVTLRDDKVFTSNVEIQKILRGIREHQDCEHLATQNASGYHYEQEDDDEDEDNKTNDDDEDDKYNDNKTTTTQEQKSSTFTSTALVVSKNKNKNKNKKTSMQCTINPNLRSCIGIQKALDRKARLNALYEQAMCLTSDNCSPLPTPLPIQKIVAAPA